VGIRYVDLDPVLEELERAGEIRRIERGVGKKGHPRQIIAL
jgi:hypothetical protein